MNSENPVFTYVALGLAVIFWGLSFVATKVALQSFTPFCLMFLRFFGASLFFAILFRRTGFPPISRKSVKSLMFLALMQPGLYFTCETLGLQYTSATKTALIIATIPVFVLALSAILLKERMRPVNLLGILLSLIGVSLLVFGDQGRTALQGSLIGDLLIFGAVLSAAAYMIMARQLGSTIPSFQITGMQIIFGAILFFPAFLWDLPKFNWEAVSADSVIALIGLTLFATIGAFLCYNYALTKIPAARASVCINGIPMVTALGAWVLLGESLTTVQLFGGVVVLVAVFLANHAPRSQAIAKIVAEV
ncbi:DMT family transporter [Desulfopila inferna]|uniref:DMT family transporter n=1 Tax=Desulfopila inferna TaxID=468528 RepID=UPI001966943A|nr:DMT family transporter [Desulfopila inferna]MBM9603746.1 EamA family transporter [Desulfopila inferna]